MQHQKLAERIAKHTDNPEIELVKALVDIEEKVDNLTSKKEEDITIDIEIV